MLLPSVSVNFIVMKIHFAAVVFFSMLLVHPVRSQDRLNVSLDFEVDRLDPPLSLTKQKLVEAKTLSDLNKHFKPTWVRRYQSVAISVNHEGITKTARSIDHMLTQDQKQLMAEADVATDIHVEVDYIPENTLQQNDLRKFDFSFLVNPDQPATYPRGYEALKAYLRESAIDKIPAGIIEGYQLAAIKFTVDESGQIINPHVFWSAENEEVDTALLHAVKNMTSWIPAQYSNGHKVAQDFAFSVGNRESCVINILNIAEN